LERFVETAERTNSMSDTIDQSRILDTGFGFWSSKVLLTAIELEVFTILSEKKLTGEELGNKLGLHPRGIWDFFDTLVALKFLERDGNGRTAFYSNTNDTAHFLDKNSSAYIGGIFEMCNARLFKFWDDLGPALKTGQPQNEVKRSQKPLFEVLYADLPRLEQFMGAMAGISRGNFTALADKLDFSKFQTLCDVGGATGLLSTLVVKRHPHINAYPSICQHSNPSQERQSPEKACLTAFKPPREIFSVTRCQRQT
jgi:Dimerisation domain/O-methyltransferase domain